MRHERKDATLPRRQPCASNSNPTRIRDAARPRRSAAEGLLGDPPAWPCPQPASSELQRGTRRGRRNARGVRAFAEGRKP